MFSYINFNPLYWVIFSSILIFILMRFYPIVGRQFQLLSARLVRSQMFVYYFLFLGTVIHELSHALLCLILGVKINKIVLFHPKKEENGEFYRLGYVEHEKVGPLRSTLIGIAPIILCSLFTYFVFIWATRDFLFLKPYDVASFFLSLKIIFLHLFNWKMLIFVYFAFACASSGEPSKEDLDSAPKTLMFLSIGLLILYFIKVQFFYNLFIFLNPIFKGITFIMFFETIILLFLYLLFRFIFKIR